MPIYEYECVECGEHCEVMQKFSDEPLSVCSSCGGRLHKLISQTSFVLKGSGWYVTDYASPERKKKEKEMEGRDVSSESKAEPKAGPKKETKAEPVAKA
ncbi:MAG: FmdB family zinc ribbon protein [Nitrospirota bacterium]